MKKTSVNGFYGKCQIYRMDNGNLYLRSYDTIVMGYVNGEWKKFWDGYSNTTMKHINCFTKSFAGFTICKKEWEKMKVDNISNVKWDNETDEIYNDIKQKSVLNERMREYGLYSKYAYGF